MASLIISCLLLLWPLVSICAADINVSERNAFNNLIIQDQPSEDGTTLEDKLASYINRIWRGLWLKPAHDNKKWFAPDNGTQIAARRHDPALIEKLPASFDPRDKWPFCHSMNDIYDQGACGSCWVFGSVPAITDRYCIASNGTKNFQASAEDALTCSDGGTCQHGGHPLKVYDYWKNKGIVSGGAYHSRAGCKPYTIPPCNIHDKGLPCSTNDYVTTPQCKSHCVTGYSGSYDKDRHFATDIYTLEGEGNIKAELYLNGPVSAIMYVYEDFITHKYGVYRHRVGELWYGHVVKIMGWGEDEGVKYWLAANSWNVEWGEKGFFRILRGENDCGIENSVITGQPKLTTG